MLIHPVLDDLHRVVPHLEYFHRPFLLFWDPIGQLPNYKILCPTPKCGARMEKKIQGRVGQNPGSVCTIQTQLCRYKAIIINAKTTNHANTIH